jgi:predicted dehydrogenase
MNKWILIAGYGSIGRRHYRNAVGLGEYEVRLLRSGPPREQSFPDPAGAKIYKSIEPALQDGPCVVIVANPTSLHANTAIAALRAGADVIMEKPIAHNLDSASQVQRTERETSRIVTMGYVFRYHPLYRRLREAIVHGELGRVFHMHAWQASYLPAWHPWEDFRAGYAARADLGGGVVRTLDHDLDMLHWLLGRPTQVFASTDALTGLDLNVEDTADMIFRFGEARTQGHVHVCFGRQDPSRGVRVIGELGSAELDGSAGTLTLHKGSEIADRVQLPSPFDLNTVYIEMLADALRSLGDGRAAIGLEAGVTALQMAMAALESSDSNRAIPIAGGVVNGSH